MQTQSNLLYTKTTAPIALYSSKQVYAMEQAWFAEGHDSFGLMKQAAWQMAQHIEQLYEQKYLNTHSPMSTGIYRFHTRQRKASIWVEKGNNGGDGWLIAYYLCQAGWQVTVTTVGFAKQDFDINHTADVSNTAHPMTDATKALQVALSARCDYQRFEDSNSRPNDSLGIGLFADVYIDALFGIGFDRAPEGVYEQAICRFNDEVRQNNALAIAVDIPSGLVASTGEVFDRVAIQADITLCLIARKFGMHTKDGVDYSGEVIDIPLIPFHRVVNQAASDKKDDQNLNPENVPVAMLLKTAHRLNARRQNSYKGSYGHVLVIGGNRVDQSQGMGGAAILSAASTMATGAGKITVACHEKFHGALLTSLPDAMTLNLHDINGVEALIKEASVIAIGMGLGRDEKAKALFISYIKAAMAEKKPLVIDADGLYHLASLSKENHELITQLRDYSVDYPVRLTPHSGEAATLLDKNISEVEGDRLATIQQCAATYGGDWVLKGAGSLVLEQQSKGAQIYVCGVGNAGMATAGMGDVLSGVIAGLLAQQDLTSDMRSLHQAVMIHGLAGDTLVNQMRRADSDNNALLIGQRGLQAQDMPAAIRHVMQLGIDVYN